MRTILAVAMVLLFAVPASADSIYGSCRIRNGETCGKSNHTLSTSWNSKKGYPDSRGDYEIDLGGSVDQRITIYCDGNQVGTVNVKWSPSREGTTGVCGPGGFDRQVLLR